MSAGAWVRLVSGLVCTSAHATQYTPGSFARALSACTLKASVSGKGPIEVHKCRLLGLQGCWDFDSKVAGISADFAVPRLFFETLDLPSAACTVEGRCAAELRGTGAASCAFPSACPPVAPCRNSVGGEGTGAGAALDTTPVQGPAPLRVCTPPLQLLRRAKPGMSCSKTPKSTYRGRATRVLGPLCLRLCDSETMRQRMPVNDICMFKTTVQHTRYLQGRRAWGKRRDAAWHLFRVSLLARCNGKVTLGRWSLNRPY